jgi:hypothetical protein
MDFLNTGSEIESACQKESNQLNPLWPLQKPHWQVIGGIINSFN